MRDVRDVRDARDPPPASAWDAAAPGRPADAWEPAVYERFRDERARPFHDLAALVEPRPGLRVVDLGCGTGALTAGLHRQLGAARTLGLDSSPAMLADAARHAGGGLEFANGAIEDFRATAEWDLVFSNAALHWVADHDALLARLRHALAPGGQLAFQVPANDAHPASRAARAVALEAPFADALGDAAGRVTPVLPPERYAERLHALGFDRQRVRVEVYAHVLADRDAVFEWLRGTTLTFFTARLPEPLRAPFLTRAAAAARDALPDARPTLFTFRRVLAWGALP